LTLQAAVRVDEVDSRTLKLDEGQQKQLAENLKKAGRDLKEVIWRSYKNLVLLGKNNQLREIDLGLINSSQADSMLALILERLRNDGDIEKDISPNFLVRNWPPAFKEWSTKSVRDAFFASPQFPRLLNAEAVKEAIARGVCGGVIAYVGKPSDGEYQPFTFGGTMSVSEVEISDEVFIIKKETAEAYQKAKASPAQTIDIPDSGSSPASVVAPSPEKSTLPQDQTPSPQPEPRPASTTVTKLTWIGDIPPQKWTTFYTKVLTKFATGKGLRLTLSLNVQI